MQHRRIINRENTKGHASHSSIKISLLLITSFGWTYYEWCQCNHSKLRIRRQRCETLSNFKPISLKNVKIIFCKKDQNISFIIGWNVASGLPPETWQVIYSDHDVCKK